MSGESEMVERVASGLCRRRVLQNAKRDRRELTADFIQRAVDAAWRDFADDARTAIEAMREPTEEMVDAGYAALMLMDAKEPNACSVTAAHRGMIDAALGTDEGGGKSGD